MNKEKIKNLNSSEINALVSVITDRLSKKNKKKQEIELKKEDDFVREKCKTNPELRKLYLKDPASITYAFQRAYPTVFKKNQYYHVDGYKIRNLLIIANISKDNINIEKLINDIIKDYEDGKI
jgi:hypothetical protein